MKTKITIMLAIAVIFRIGMYEGCYSPTPQQPAENLGQDGIDFHNRKFIVINVVDGDTVDIALALDDPNTTRIRLLGVDTPETKHPQMPVQYFGPQATQFVAERVMNSEVTVRLDPASDIRGKYGRLLAYIELPDSTDLGEQLLAHGLAYAYTQYPSSKREL